MLETKRFTFSAISDKYERLNIERPYTGEVDLFKVYDEELQILWDAGAITPATKKLFMLEILGGRCEACGKSWVPVEYHHKLHGEEILSFTYYKPDCNCYLHCKRCYRMMYVETVEKKNQCDACGNAVVCFNKIPKEDKNGKMRKQFCKQKKIPTLHGWKCPVCDADHLQEETETALPYKD